MRKMIVIFFVILLCFSTYASSAENSWTCPNCSFSNDGLFCTNCGTAKPSDKWSCPNCAIENDGNFCSNCGTKKPSSEVLNVVTIEVKINGKNRKGEYSGDLSNGKPNGHGSFTSSDSYPSVKYDGEWKNGNISGEGYMEMDEYSIHFETTQGKYDRKGPYRGSVKNGLPDGHGYFSTYNDYGKRWDYDGEWSNGHMNGKGKQQWYEDDGTVTAKSEGNFVDDEFIPVSLIVPSDAYISGNYAGTHRARLQFDILNYSKSKTIISYVVEHYSVDVNGNKVSQPVSTFFEQQISPGMRTKSGNIFVEYGGASGVSVAITKVTFSDGTYEVAEPYYYTWTGLF